MKKLTGLTQFAAVCASRNLTQAASDLGVSQPALTQAIAKLEKQLDVVLFDRATRPMALTPYGELVLEYAHQVVKSTETLTDKLEAMKTGSGGVLRIGAGPDWIHEILPIAISELQRDHPGIRVDLTVSLNDQLRGMLDRGEIDLPPPSVETNSVRAMINILRYSPKLGFLSHAHAHAYPEIKVVETTVPMPIREGGVVWRVAAPLMPVAEQLLARARETIRARVGHTD